jgi:hypothetical protein
MSRLEPINMAHLLEVVILKKWPLCKALYYVKLQVSSSLVWSVKLGVKVQVIVTSMNK